MELATKHASLRSKVGDIVQHTDELLTSLRDGAQPAEQTDEAASRNIETTPGIFCDSFSSFRSRLEDQDLVVAVLALTKSGKSTLLNALIGANCLPANNVPETARIVRVTHAPGAAELLDKSLSAPKLVTGEEDIKTYLRYLNTEARSREHSHSDETLLDLRIPIAAFDRFIQAAAPDVAVRLLDTPGPNEAGETALKAQVERLLDSVDAIIYVLDYTKLKTADEAEVLRRLKEINPQLMGRLAQRLFFVVNKADMIETSEGMDAAATKQYVASLITQQMQIEGFQLKPEQVLLLSAQQALLSRLVLEAKADQDSLSRFGRLAFGSRAHKYSQIDYLEAAEEMQIDSGLAALEETVLGFLYAHSGNLKLLALLDDLTRMLQQVRNVAAASNAALQHDVSALQAETEQMQSRLASTLASFDRVQQDAQAVEGEVVDEVQQRMQRLKEKLFEEVTAALEPSRQPAAGRWQEAWLRASRFLMQRHSQRHRRDLQARLHELHAAISSSIEAEVQDFWKDVETATNERQRSMFLCINQHLQSLSRQIEATVGRVLEVRLEPVTISMDPPAAQDFHESLQNLFALGIRSRSEQRSRERVHNYTVWEPRFRNSLCRTGQYFVGRPACRRVTEQYQQPIYDLQPDHIKEYFISVVDATVESSVKYVREYVHAYLSDTLSEARGHIQEYADSFSHTMQAALATRQQGEQARSEALAAVQAHLASTDKLLTDVVVTQRQIEACLPGYVPSSHDDLPESSAAAADAYHAVPAEPELASAVHAEHAEQNKPEIEVEVAVPLGSAEAEHNVGSAQAVPELLQPGLAQSIAKSSAADMSPDVRPAWQPSSSKYGQGASSSQGPMPEQAHSPPAASPARPSRPAHANPVRQPGVQFPPPPDFPDIQLPVSPDFSNVHFPPSPDHSHAPFPAFPEFPAFPTFPDYAAGSGAPGLDELRDYVSSTVDAATGFASAAAGFGAAAASSFMPRPYHHRNRPSRRGYRNRSRSSDSSSNSTASSTSSDSSRGSSSSSSSESSSSTAGGGRAPVSPLPAMMIELQDAMTASDSRADADENEQSAQPSAAAAPAAAAMVGTDLDEEAQLELAMFLSMEEAKAAEATAKAADAAASPSEQTAPEATQTAAACVAADADQELPSHDAASSDQAGPATPQEVLNPLLEVRGILDPTEEVMGHDLPASSEHDPFAGSVHSELSSAGPARSPVATDSEADTWQFLDDTPEHTAAQLAATSDADQAAAHADAASAAAVPVGQAIAASLRSMTPTSSDLDGVPSAAVPTEQFAALSLVDTLASNPGGEDVQLQLDTENSQFLQYCLDPINGVLPQHTRPAVSDSPTADNSHNNGTWAGDGHELSSSPRDEGLLGEAAANETLVGTPVTVTGLTQGAGMTHLPESYAQPTPLSPQSQLHATALGGDVFRGTPSATGVDHGAFVMDDEDDVSSLVGGVGYQQHIWEPTVTPHEADAPASIHVEQEHEGADQPDEASGQEDGSEWSMIDSDVDEHEELLR